MIASSPAWAGNLPNWILIALALMVAWRVSRGGGGSAVTELSKANEVLEKRVHDLGAEVRDLRIEKASLEARTDFEGSLSRAIVPLADAMGAQTAQLDRHEVGAQARSERLITLIDERIPADPGKKAA